MVPPWPGAVCVRGGFGPQWMDAESVEHLRRMGVPVVLVDEGEGSELPEPSLECYVSEPEPVAVPVKRRPGRPRKIA